MNNVKRLENTVFKHCTNVFSDNQTIKNFSITFENGFTLSLAMGYGMGSERINEPYNFDEYKSVEFAVIDPNNKILQIPEMKNELELWASPARVLEIMNLVSELKSYE